MKLLEGIQLHELILIILGFILGLALIFIFLFTALRSKPNLKLLYGFVAPLVMIGYPSFQSIEFSKDVLKIDKLVAEVNQNPTDTAAQNALRANLQTLPASRCIKSSDAMTVIAKSQAALGLFDSAKETIEKAKIINPNNPMVTNSEKEIKEQWSTQKDFTDRVKTLDRLIKQLEITPNNNTLKDSLATHVKELTIKSQRYPIHLENKQIATVATATAIIGRQEEAENITNEVLDVDPKNKEMSKVRDNIKNKEIDKKFNTQRTKPIPKIKDNVRPNNATKVITKIPQEVSTPAPYASDTSPAPLRMRLVPRSAAPLKVWDKTQ
jgi:tetratricopeptide (TPR) repeat protein